MTIFLDTARLNVWRRTLLFARLISSACVLATTSLVQAQAPTTTLPNGRRITPSGKWIPTAPYPFALAVRPDGKQLAVPSIGFPFALTVIDAPGTPSQETRRFPEGATKAKDVEVDTGIAYAPDGRHGFVSAGDSGTVSEYETDRWSKVRQFSLGEDSYSGSLALDPSGNLIYVLDQGNWRVVAIEVSTGRVAWTLPTGVDPIALAVSPDGQRLYVANAGMFEYQLLPGLDRGNILQLGLPFAPFGYPSRQARQILGSFSSDRGSSLWTYSLRSTPQVTGKLHLGGTVHGRVLGGSAPSALAANSEHVYAALAHTDSVAVITVDGRKLERKIALSPFEQDLRGVMPSGLALSVDDLYVTEAGINSVATVDLHSNTVIGHEPVGWNPSAVAVSPDSRSLFVVNTKGKGTGPNGGAAFPKPGGAYIGDLAFGSVSILGIGGASAATTKTVLANNRAALAKAEGPPRLKHVFFIIRENRTYDEVLGDLPGADGDRSIARYGLDGWTEEAPHLQHLQVTPNAHAIATQFATSDQFFVDSDVSADGHRWLLGIAPTPWFNRAWTSHYGGRRHQDAFSRAPGRRAMFGGSDAPMPEDEPQFGSLWEHVAGAHLPIRNYGESLEIEGSDEREGTEPEGQRLLLNAPFLRPVFESSDRHYPTFNLGIPDVHRVREFRKDFGKLVQRNRVPALTVIRLPNDHTATPRSGDGYPYRASYVADNDLALGQILEYLSSLSTWKDSAVLVLEDDAQGGRDHVDAHRSVLLVASPWVKPGVIGHQHVSMGSVEKTIYSLLGLKPLNLEDALASDLSELFDAQPHTGSFRAISADPRVFDPATARIAKPKSKEEAAALLRCDDPQDMR